MVNVAVKGPTDSLETVLQRSNRPDFCNIAKLSYAHAQTARSTRIDYSGGGSGSNLAQPGGYMLYSGTMFPEHMRRMWSE